MNVKHAIRIAASIALVTGLFAGPTISATADPGPPRTTAAKTETLIKKKCLKGFPGRLAEGELRGVGPRIRLLRGAS